MYKQNFTILSSITQDVIFAKTFADEKFRSVAFDVYDKYLLLRTKARDELKYAQIKNEDKDAWSQYLKKGQIKQALENCSSSQHAIVAGIYAD